MTPSEQIDKQIQNAGGWKAALMTKLRNLVHEADAGMQEEWKWDVGVYVHNGMVCAISDFKDHVKINFFKGAQLEDPEKLFNNGLDSKKHRSIDLAEGDTVNEKAVRELITKAAALNTK